jgi:hypothetical protein
MKKALILLLLTLGLGGCIHRDGGYYSHQNGAVAATPKCRPSHHWDGTMCRHNGRGEGARKLDYYP